MVKRRTAALDDEDENTVEGVESSPPIKRAKREPKDITNNQDRSDEDEIMEDNKEEEEVPDVDLNGANGINPHDEEAYEELNEEKIKAQISQKTRHGMIAQAGVISSLEVKNFMCHRHLTFDFGPQINFITGRNGSGKSAVLSALQIALGARTYLTGRGTNLKTFIKEGREEAEIWLRIKNDGPEAFKPHEYGKMITIYRKIKKDGSGAWQMKSKDGRVISRAKSELQEMSDHMNIQIDSPLNVLTQDSARQFLAGSTAADKYAFFLKGTQLAQLTEEYEVVNNNIKKADKILAEKEEIVPQLKEAALQAANKLKESEKARDQSKKLKDLKKELAWSHVAGKHRELLAKQEQQEEHVKRVEKTESHLQEAKANVLALEAANTELEESQRTDEAADAQLSAERKEVADQIKKNIAKLQEFKAEQAQINQSMNTINELIAKVDRLIAAENLKLQSDESLKREKLRVQLNETRALLEAKEAEIETLKVEKLDLEQSVQRLNGEGQAADNDRIKTDKELADTMSWKQNLLNNEKSKFNAFGNNIERILHDIKNARWQGSSPPIGPLGMYVNLKDATYRSVLQNQIGGAMFNFVVAHFSDRQQLTEILKRNGNWNNQVQIIIAEPDIFDYSAGVPHNPSTVTPLHVLDVTNEWVKRILINSHRIEGIGLAKTRAEAQSFAEHDAGRTYWTADGFRVQKYHDGGWFSTPLSPINQRDPRRNLFGNGDSNNGLQAAQEKEKELREKLNVITRVVDGIRESRDRAGQSLLQCKNKGSGLYGEIQGLRNKKAQLEEQSQEDAPMEVAALEDERAAHVNEKDTIKAQFVEVEQRKQQVEQENRPLAVHANALRERANEVEQEKERARKKLQRLFEQVVSAKKAQNGWQNKLTDVNKEGEGIALQLAVLEEEYADWHSQASEYCEEIKKPRKTDFVQVEVIALEAALKKRERRLGASVEDMEADVARTRRALEAAEGGLKELRGLFKNLKAALHKRMEKWHAFRRAIALRAKVQFQYHLSKRDYTGKIIFDHGAATLSLRVQTDDQVTNNSQAGSKDKDPKSLSGGEKSYAQICLLLALWESIGSPIRCLDEFDVFMDNMNRRIAMRLMIETAKTSEAKQYIFISPLDIGNFIDSGPEIKVNRMPDPERGRGQTSLPFAGDDA